MKLNEQRVLAAICTESMTWYELEKTLTTDKYMPLGVKGFSDALGYLLKHKLVHQVAQMADDGSRLMVYAPTLRAWTTHLGKPEGVEYKPYAGDKPAGYYARDGALVPWPRIYASEAEAVRAVGGGK